jgi:hypothetical protein
MKLSEKITQAMLEGQVRDFSDAYQGAMEEVAIWKRRALEAETLNRKFIAGINSPMHMGEPAQPAQKAVAYLDLGVGGYMDIGTDLTDEQLASLPKGRHMLSIVGTYGVDGYVSAQPGAQPAPSISVDVLTDHLVSISAHIAHQDDTKAQAELGELLKLLAAAQEATP